MFRRREDEMNESDSSGQGSLLGGSDAVKVLPPEASGLAPASAPGASSAPAASAFSPTPREAASRAQSGSPMNAFRQQADMGRGRGTDAKAGAFSAAGAQSANARESRRVLTVGADILLKGEIATCDRLVIEGKVDAVLNDVGTVELAESGSFKGVAQVENAEISGLFEGELVVKGRLVIYASGRVRGKVTYGEIEIERGGEVSGEVKNSGNPASAARPTIKSKEKAEAA